MPVNRWAVLTLQTNRVSQRIEDLLAYGAVSPEAVRLVVQARRDFAELLKAFQRGEPGNLDNDVSAGVRDAYHALVQDYLYFIIAYIQAAVAAQGEYLSARISDVRSRVAVLFHKHSKNGEANLATEVEFFKFMNMMDETFDQCQQCFDEARKVSKDGLGEELRGSLVEWRWYAIVLTFGVVMFLLLGWSMFGRR